MRTRRLGRTDRLVSEIGLGGAWLLGRRGDLPMDQGIATVRRALECGVTYIDTAECYIGGRSEEVIGKALEGVEADPFLATKFGHRPETFDFSRESVIESACESLRRLRRSSIDLFQLHTPAEPTWEHIFGPGGAMDGMREVRERGLCRYLGITGRDIDFLRRCVETDEFDTLLVFQRYDLMDQSGESLLADARAHDMGVMIGSPLRMGLFGSARDSMLPRVSEAERRHVAALDRMFAAEPNGVKGGALRFLLASPDVSVVLSGAGTPDEIEEAVAIARQPIDPALVRQVNALGER